MRPSIFVDSWGWIVLANRNETSFSVVRDLYQREAKSGGRIITSDFVLDEVVTFLFSRAPAPLTARYLKELFASIDKGLVEMERVSADRFEKTWRMRLRYQDHPGISFTDFTSFVIMQELSVTQVLTQDRHFEEVNLGFIRIP